MSLKPYAKKLWVDALRSGNYAQVCDRMIADDEQIGSKKCKGMCVMGVLADVAMRDSGLPMNYLTWREFARGNEEPTNRTLQWAGLDISTMVKMIDENDKRVKTFDQFAQYIEENL